MIDKSIVRNHHTIDAQGIIGEVISCFSTGIKTRNSKMMWRNINPRDDGYYLCIYLDSSYYFKKMEDKK